jgi:hypothetical protein
MKMTIPRSVRASVRSSLSSPRVTDSDDAWECRVCGDVGTTNFGDEPTPICNHCAQAIAFELAGFVSTIIHRARIRRGPRS